MHSSNVITRTIFACSINIERFIVSIRLCYINLQVLTLVEGFNDKTDLTVFLS